MDLAKVTEFAKRYAEAWSSRKPENVAAFYVENATISVNDGPPAPIIDVARVFMRDFPDMIVTMDDVTEESRGVAFHWTLDGTNTGPGGTGKHVHISGYELWQLNADGLIASSEGHFDSEEYERQLKL